MLFPTAGSRLYTADAPTGRDGTIPAGGWVEIGEVEALGLLGVDWATDEVEVAEAAGWGEPLTAWTVKRSRAALPMQIVMGNDPTDPGQAILWKAARLQDHFPFRLDFPAAGPNRRWLALVVSLAEVFDGANGIMKIQALIVPSMTAGIQRSEDT